MKRERKRTREKERENERERVRAAPDPCGTWVRTRWRPHKSDELLPSVCAAISSKNERGRENERERERERVCVCVRVCICVGYVVVCVRASLRVCMCQHHDCWRRTCACRHHRAGAAVLTLELGALRGQVKSSARKEPALPCSKCR